MIAGIMAGGRPVPPTATPSDPYWGNVSLLLHADGADGATTTVDSSGFAHTVTRRAAATLSTTQKRFGASSMKFTGNGGSSGASNSAFLVTTTAALALGTGDFTLEGWVYMTAKPIYYSILIDFRPAFGGGNYPTLYVDSSLALLHHRNGATIMQGGAVALNTQTHWAMCRSSGNVRLFLNGVQVGSTYADSTNYLVDRRLVVAESAQNEGYGSLGGYLDELRITKGAARYTANFTPPTAAFPNS